jgi:hypothetical protein
VISLVYLVTRILPTSMKAKLSGIIKIELTQVFISILIILILFGSTTFLCNAVIGLGQSTVQPNSITQSQSTSIPFPALQTPNTVLAARTGDPFAIAESYTGNYAFDIGPNLAVQVYAYSYSYAIISAIWTNAGSAISQVVTNFLPLNGTPVGPFLVTVSFPEGIDLGIPYGLLSNVFLSVLSPLVILGIGIMLFQYIILVIAQSSAFLVILPVALIMRSISFSGVNLRPAANSILAFSIALYIVYPLMIVFNSYALAWIFTPCTVASQLNPLSCNPSATYLEYTYDHDNLNGVLGEDCVGSNINIGVNIAVPSCSTAIGYLESAPGTLANALSGIVGYSFDDTILGVQYIMLEISEFLFTVIVMFAIDITVTLGFAMGLTRALNGGIEGAASFWSSV